MAQIVGVSRDELLWLTEPRNVLPWPPSGGSHGTTGAEWRVGGAALRPLLRGRRVIAAGACVAHAIGVEGQELYQWVGDVARIPHPSGRNRMLNSEEERMRLREFMREALGL